ncbi:MAG TPA: lactate utilization protein [Paracoccaceae bacterium]|nr:lactate utilization protein [Paracoccaceae bacterium]
MTARDRIMARIRAAQSPARELPPPLRPALAEVSGEAAIRQFIAKAKAVSTTLSPLEAIEDLPGVLADELHRRDLPLEIRTGAEPLFALDWGEITHTSGPGRIEEPATLTRAEFGMAETGSLVFASGRENPVTLNFLGETHFALLDVDDIVGGYEELWDNWRERGLNPRTVNFITGPSRSADIGQVLQLGAHGPVALHVFLLGGGAFF